MSTVTDRTTERERQGTGPPLIIHRYPGDPSYRRSGQRVPQVGDIALCGWVKKIPHGPLQEAKGPTCVVCADLAGLS